MTESKIVCWLALPELRCLLPLDYLKDLLGMEVLWNLGPPKELWSFVPDLLDLYWSEGLDSLICCEGPF